MTNPAIAAAQAYDAALDAAETAPNGDHYNALLSAVVGADEQVFTVAQTEAALCIWEWMLEARAVPGEYNSAGQVGAAPWRAAMMELWEGVGTGQMRMLAWELSPGVEGLYQSLCAELGEDELRAVFCAYDWEFIPAVCLALDWAKGGQMQSACYQAGPVELPASVRAAVLTEYREGKARDDANATGARRIAIDLAAYKERCRRAAGRMWGFPDLVAETDDSPGYNAASALGEGKTPEEWAREAGEHYDLAEPDPFTLMSLAEAYAEPVTP